MNGKCKYEHNAYLSLPGLSTIGMDFTLDYGFECEVWSRNNAVSDWSWKYLRQNVGRHMTKREDIWSHQKCRHTHTHPNRQKATHTSGCADSTNRTKTPGCVRVFKFGHFGNDIHCSQTEWTDGMRRRGQRVGTICAITAPPPDHIAARLISSSSQTMQSCKGT